MRPVRPFCHFQIRAYDLIPTMGIALSWRDDLESFSDVFLYLLMRSLLWQSLRRPNQLAGKERLHPSVERLFQHCPVEFLDFHEYARRLSFAARLYYTYHKARFGALLKNRLVLDGSLHIMVFTNVLGHSEKLSSMHDNHIPTGLRYSHFIWCSE